jgi:hypothetical protein
MPAMARTRPIRVDLFFKTNPIYSSQIKHPRIPLDPRAMPPNFDAAKAVELV